MNDLQIISGVECYEKDGVAYLKLENVARGLGFTTIAASGNEVIRWNTVYNYLSDLKVVAGSCNANYKDNCPDFIPENIFYRLAMKAKNETAEKFQALVADEIIPAIRKHGMYATDNIIEKILENPDFGIELLIKLKEERKEKERLQQELDQSKDWYSIKRVAALNGVSWKKFNWRLLKETGAEMGYEVKKIFDANYGEVNTYHKDVWEKVYPTYEL